MKHTRYRPTLSDVQRLRGEVEIAIDGIDLRHGPEPEDRHVRLAREELVKAVIVLSDAVRYAIAIKPEPREEA